MSKCFCPVRYDNEHTTIAECPTHGDVLVASHVERNELILLAEWARRQFEEISELTTDQTLKIEKRLEEIDAHAMIGMGKFIKFKGDPR